MLHLNWLFTDMPRLYIYPDFPLTHVPAWFASTFNTGISCSNSLVFVYYSSFGLEMVASLGLHGLEIYLRYKSVLLPTYFEKLSGTCVSLERLSFK